jgi:hypothetical protein
MTHRPASSRRCRLRRHLLATPIVVRFTTVPERPSPLNGKVVGQTGAFNAQKKRRRFREVPSFS